MAAWQPGLALDSPGAWVATRSHAVPRPASGSAWLLLPGWSLAPSMPRTPLCRQLELY